MSCLVNLPRLRSCFQLILAASLFFAMTAFKTYPLIVHRSTHIPGFPGDPLLNVWIMAWDFHALSTDPWNLFNANIFYPASNTLALSEHLLGVLPIFAPTYALIGNPILAYNMVFLLSFTLSGMAMFLLVRYWTQHYWAALVAGFLFAFAPIRFEAINHIQLLNLYWAPLAFLWLEKFLRSKLWKDLAGFSIFYWLQVLSSVYLGWFTTIAVAVYVLCNVLCVRQKFIDRAMVFRFATFATLSILILLPLHFPYYQVKQQYGIFPPLQQSIDYSSDLLLSYITVPDFMNDLYFSIFRRASESDIRGRVLFPGLVVPLLIVFGSIARRWSAHTSSLNYMRYSYWAVLISSFLLSLGPYLLILGKNTDIPLPYLLLYYLAPGFQAMRVPARFGLMMVLAASVLAAYGFLRLCQALEHICTVRKFPVRACYAVVAFSCLALFTLELGCKPLLLTRMPVGLEVPPVYRWLAAERPGPLVELPAGMWENFRYQYFSTYHWLPLVNGTSGYGLPTYGLIDKLQPIPSQEAIMSLNSIGAKVVVVHYDELPFYEALQWHQAAVALGLEQVARFGADLVYSVPFVDSTHEPEIKLLIPDRLPIASTIRVGLLVHGSDDRLWTYPRSSHREPVIVEWVEQSTGQTLIQEKSLEWTLPSDAMRTKPVGVSVETPPSPGRYLLTLRIPAFDRETAPHSVELTRDSFMTSANAPQMLSAGYFWEGPQPQLVTSQPIPIGVRVINTGQATWLANPKDLRGTTSLEWRWFKGDQEISSLGGREPLAYDVFPGQAFTFRTKIIPPTEPGEYRLEFYLVSDSMTLFAAQGESPLQLAIRVLHLARSNFDRWLAEQSQGLADPLHFSLSAERRRYRRGETLNLLVTVNAASSAHWQIVDSSLVLVWPDGRAFVLGKGGIAPFTPGRLDPFLRGVRLPQSGGPLAIVPIGLQFAEMPYGPYTVHIVVTEANTAKVIAKTEALFSLEP